VPCNLGKLCTCSSEQKQFCKNWEPGRGSKYYKCARFISARASCDKPKSACKTCAHHIAKLPRRESTIDWSDPEQRRAYRAKYMRGYRRGERRREK